MLLRSPCKISEPYDNPFWEKSKREKVGKGEKEKQAGAELCQAQFKLGLAKTAVASHVLASIVS